MLLKACQRLLPNPVGGVSVSGVMTVLRQLIISISFLPFIVGHSSLAQDRDESQSSPPGTAEQTEPPSGNTQPDILEVPLPDIRPEIENEGRSSDRPTDTTDDLIGSSLEGVLKNGPDYSKLTKKREQEVRLKALFERLKVEKDPESANLISEEIWAIWLDSGSPTIDMILRRGTAFEKRGETAAARRMYDHVTTLMPDYAEGWARSARLAMEEEDYDRALSESAQALILEPREYYALWTMGNVLEKLGRTAQAYEAYQAALELYPEHPAIKARVETLKTQIDGEVL